MGKSIFVVKHLGAIKNRGNLLAHIKYIGYRSREQEMDERGFFDKEADNIKHHDFWDRVTSHKALRHSECVKAHKMIFSLKEIDYEAYKRSGKDYKDLVRSTMEKYESTKGVKLDWIASIHDTKGHPHVHIVIKSVSDIKGDRGYTRIRFKFPDDMRMFKDILQKDFERDVQYKWHEKIDIRESIKSVKSFSKGIAHSIRMLENEGGNNHSKIKAKGNNRFNKNVENQRFEEDTNERYTRAER